MTKLESIVNNLIKNGFKVSDDSNSDAPIIVNYNNGSITYKDCEYQSNGLNQSEIEKLLRVIYVSNYISKDE